eukprot:scaffold1368_cov138-Alexandrium_tamarense.AAC.7
MDGIFAACKFSKEAADMAIHVYGVNSGYTLAYLREADCISLCNSIQRPYYNQGGQGYPVGPIQSGRLKLAAHHLFKHHF